MKFLFAVLVSLIGSESFAYSAFYPEIPPRALRNRNHLKIFLHASSGTLEIHYPDGSGKPTLTSVLGTVGRLDGCYRSFEFRASHRTLNVYRAGREAGLVLMLRDFRTLSNVIGPILDPNNVLFCVLP